MTDKVSKLTVAEGLRELKLISDRLALRRQNINRYSSKMEKSKDEIENQRDYVSTQFQSAKDLLQRYSNIKLGIQLANLNSRIVFKTFDISVAEALLYKQYLHIEHEKLLSSFTPSNAARQVRDRQRALGLGQLTPELAESLNLMPELYYDERDIQNQKEDLLDFMAYLDALIDKTNHNTYLDIDIL